MSTLEATTPGFSIFAVTGESFAEEIVGGVPEEILPEGTPEEIEKPAPEFDRTAVAGIAVIIVGAVMVGVFFVKRRRKKR